MADPLLRSELNRRMRERHAFWIPTLFLLTLMLVFGNTLVSHSGQPYELGAELFTALTKVSVWLMTLAVPVFAAGSITIEREQRTLEPLLLSRLTATAIVRGKLLATAGYAQLVIATSLPLLAVPWLLGGVPLSAIFVHYLSLGALTMCLGSLGLFLSASFRRSVYAIALNYALLALTLFLAAFLIGYLESLERQAEVVILAKVAFLSPLYLIESATRPQWPWFVLTYLTAGALFSALAVSRLRLEIAGDDEEPS